jgi:hypothetical protein
VIRVLEWIDPHRMQVLAFRLRDHFKGADGQHHLVVCKGEWRHTEYDRWGSLKSAITRAKGLAARSGYELLQAEVEALDAGADIPWQEVEPKTLLVRVGITWNPMDLIYYPPMAHTVLPGQVVSIPPGRWSGINMGKTQRLHLCLELREIAVTEGSA